MTDNDDLPSLEELDRSIKEAKKKASGEDRESSENASAGIFRVSVDLLAGVLVGSFAGYYLDKWLGTLPVFFIICFFLGVAGSFLNIYRSTQRNLDSEED